MGQDKMPRLRSWMNPEQAAEASGYSTKTIYRALRDGELVASKRRRRWRIRPEALTEWIDGDRAADVPATGRVRTRKAAPKGSLRAILDAQKGEAA